MTDKTTGYNAREREAELAKVTTENARLRGYLLAMLRADPTGCDRGDLVAALSPAPAESMWRHHADVPNPTPDGWYLWRDPDEEDRRAHADQAIVEDGKITSKWGCGIVWYSECAPLELPADVAEILVQAAAATAPG